MENKTTRAARRAKDMGYEYIAAIVKNVYTTNYYNVQSVDDIISAGKWIPAQRHYRGYRIGQSHLPEHTILKSRLFGLI